VTRLAVLAPPDFAPLQMLRDANIDLTAGIDDAEAVLIAPRSALLLRDLLPQAKRLRWIHALGAGVESLPFDALRNTRITVTNSRGLYADASASLRSRRCCLWLCRRDGCWRRFWRKP